jgi:hypothetical protein
LDQETKLTAGPAGERSLRSLREDMAGKLLMIAFLIGMPIGLASSQKTFNDGDTSWHIAAGRWIFEHHGIPSTDPFSFTAAGKPWVAMEWLSELIYAAAFGIAGHAGLVAIVAAALVALHTIVYLHIRRSFGPLGICATIVCMDIALGAFITARPHLLIWPLLAGWTALMLRSLDSGRPPPWWSALLLVLWTNLHGSFPLAIVIAGAIAFDALIVARWKNWREWAAFLAVCVVAVMLNANGVHGFLQPFHVAGLKTLPHILEWAPSTPEMTPQFYAVLLLVLGALLLNGVKVPLGRLLLLLTMLALAFSQLRHQSWLGIVAALVLPPLFNARGRYTDSARPFVAIAVVLIALRACIPLEPPENTANPRRTIAAVPIALRTQPVLNDYQFGGPLILAGIKPYIDGRSEMYGDEFFADYVKIIDGDRARFDRAVARYGIRWTILAERDHALIAQLDKSKNWRRIHSDRIGVIHVRLD